MNCQRVQRFLSLYQDGHPIGREDAVVAAHLRDCPACRQFREAMEAWSGKARAVGGHAPTLRAEVRSRALDEWMARREGLTAMRRVWPLAAIGGRATPALIWGMAAVVVLMGALGLGRWEGRQRHTVSRGLAVPEDGPTQPGQHGQQLAVKPPAEPGVYTERTPLKRARENETPRISPLQRGSSRLDGGFSPRPAPWPQPAPSAHDQPSLPDTQYLDGRDPSLLARWSTLGSHEQRQLEAVLRRLPRPADDFARIPFPLIAAAGSGEAAIAAAAREYGREAKVVDPRLFRKVTLQDKGVALSDLCAELQAQTGVQFRASRTVGDEKATVFVKEEPARDVMRAISHLFGYAWVRSRRDGEYRYELDQDLRSQLQEEELRSRDRNAALLAMDRQAQAFRPYMDLSNDEFRKRWDQLPRSEQGPLVNVALNGGWGGMLLYHRLSLRDRAALIAGQEVVFRPKGTDPDHRLSDDLDHQILTAWNPRVAGEDRPVGELPGAHVPQVRLRLDRSELGQVRLISTTSVAWPPGSSTRSEIEIASGQSPSAANPDNAIVNQALRNESPFHQVASVVPKPSCPADKSYRQADMDLDLDTVFFNFDLSKAHAVSADAWEAVHQATGLPIVADFYTRLYPADKLRVEGKPLFDALCTIGDTLGARWRKDGDFLLCRSTSYFWDKLKEVPNRYLQRWGKDRDANGGLPLADVMEMAAMPDQQLDSATVSQGIEQYWKLPEWGQLTYPLSRHQARFLPALTPEQLQRAFTEDGMPFTELTPAQQRGAMAMFLEGMTEMERESGESQAPVPSETWSHAFVTAKYLPAGWYAWIPPRDVRNGRWNGPRGPFGGRTAPEALAEARRHYPAASPQDVHLSRGGYLTVNLPFVFHNP
jgi:hypothetical protein